LLLREKVSKRMGEQISVTILKREKHHATRPGA
jgi:hypothetical protein